MIMRGAEAIVKKAKLLGEQVVVKERISKSYRVKELDIRLRKERTRSEARLLHKSKLAGVDCPTVLEITDFNLTLSFIAGDRPNMNENNSGKCGEILAKLHNVEIIHGDYTPANILQSKKQLFVIDFGLGFISQDIEDKAVDVFTMLRSLKKEKSKQAFIQGYKKHAKKSDSIIKRVKVVEKRVRYAN